MLEEREPCASCIMQRHDLPLLCLGLRAACASHTALQPLACIAHELAVMSGAANAQATTMASTRARMGRAR